MLSLIVVPLLMIPFIICLWPIPRRLTFDKLPSRQHFADWKHILPCAVVLLLVALLGVVNNELGRLRLYAILAAIFGLYIAIPIGLSGGFIHLVHAARPVGPRAAIPLAANLGLTAIAIGWFFSTSAINYRINEPVRQTVVRMIESGELTPEFETGVTPRQYRITLPWWARHSARHGEVIVLHQGAVTFVFFSTFSGGSGYYSALLYRSDDAQLPTPEDRELGTDCWKFGSTEYSVLLENRPTDHWFEVTYSFWFDCESLRFFRDHR